MAEYRHVLELIRGYFNTMGQRTDEERLTDYAAVIQDLPDAALDFAFYTAARQDNKFPLSAGSIRTIANGWIREQRQLKRQQELRRDNQLRREQRKKELAADNPPTTNHE